MATGRMRHQPVADDSIKDRLIKGQISDDGKSDDCDGDGGRPFPVQPEDISAVGSDDERGDNPAVEIRQPAEKEKIRRIVVDRRGDVAVYQRDGGAGGAAGQAVVAGELLDSARQKEDLRRLSAP